jgi:hypothetical protein
MAACVIVRSRITVPPPQDLVHSVFFQKVASQLTGQGAVLHSTQRMSLVGQTSPPCFGLLVT